MKENYLSKPLAVEVFPVDGGADVIMRKNIEEVTRQETNFEEISETTVWECDEVQFRYPGFVTSEEIEEDFDYYFENGSTLLEKYQENLDIEAVRAKKREEISIACQNAIYAGVDVELSVGTEHFSLAVTDQLNLFGKQAQLAAGSDLLEYHQDGEPCKFYSAADMGQIITAAMKHVSYHTTYCNSMFSWIKACSKASEISEIAYGAEIPEAYRSEVLVQYLAGEGTKTE